MVILLILRSLVLAAAARSITASLGSTTTTRKLLSSSPSGTSEGSGLFDQEKAATAIDLHCSSYGEEDSWHAYRSGTHHGELFDDKCKADDDPVIQGSFSAYDGFTCYIEFFAFPDEVETIFELQTSKMCTNNNRATNTTVTHSIYKVKVAVRHWDDECVTDIPRCYSVSTHTDLVNKISTEDRFRKQLCQSNIRSLPPGTTHWSVDCTKAATRNKEKEAGLVLGVVLFYGSGLLLCCCCFRKCYKELSKNMAASNNESNLNLDIHSGGIDGPYTLCSMMICGISCLVQKERNAVASSTISEREQFIATVSAATTAAAMDDRGLENGNGSDGAFSSKDISMVEMT